MGGKRQSGRSGIPGGAAAGTKASKASIREFHGMLVLAQWARSFFDGEKFERLQAALNKSELEGVDAETGHTRFFLKMTGESLFNLNRVDVETFGRYDKNIVRHWAKITKRRNESGERVEMKYYQYLSLLVAELYLDWYFNRKPELIKEVSERIDAYNSEHRGGKIAAFEESDLNKIAFWEATGAGKTFLMHVNILQYLEYAGRSRAPDRIIVLTPYEGLSKQHVADLSLSGFAADLMSENSLFEQGSAGAVSVVDSHKLISDVSAKKKGEKSFMAESFEGNNLVLVDEGHHGKKDDSEHRRTRNLLCRDGFSFEYSATFGQAVAENGVSALKSLYAKSILFDYSYKYFHEDGYGKEAFILNLPDDKNDEQVFRYLCANLLAYYQQHRLYAAHPEVMRTFGIAKPLCVFVGYSVMTSGEKAKEENRKEISDVLQVVGFFADVLERRKDVENLFGALVRDEDVLMANKANPMKGRFAALKGLSGEDIYADMLRFVFNADHVAKLKVQHEKAQNEITLSVNVERPFGLVYIGDSGEFMKTLDGDGRFEVLTKDVGDSHFERINDTASEISVLVGARKFTEGWSSWRVSSMGLLNMGVKEGTQIIQLFGRGVRLKGRGLSLKRSTLAERRAMANGCFLEFLETLQVFGIRADYMSKFKEYLEAEGIETQDEVLVVDFPVGKNPYPSGLAVPQVKNGYRLNQRNGFKTQGVTLFEITKETGRKIKSIRVKYDDYAYVQMLPTKKEDGAAELDGKPVDVKLDRNGLRLLDWDEIYRLLLEEKGRNGWWNLAIDRQRLIEFALKRDDWYELVARKDDVAFTSFRNLENIKRLFKILILAYMGEFYKRMQNLYESEHMEMRPIDESWFPGGYRFEIDNSEIGHRWQEQLEKLREIVAKEDVPYQEINQWMSGMGSGFVVIAFKQHVYRPLFGYEENASVPFTFKPLSLGAPSEVKFVRDLENFYNNSKNQAVFDGIDLYLMRNASNKLKGNGFAQAGNFYPDFLMWIVDKKTNALHLIFIDPKGIHGMSPDHPKMNFSTEVKNLEAEVNKGCTEKFTLSSVILACTDENDLLFPRSEYEAKGVIFMVDDYISKLLAAVRKDGAGATSGGFKYSIFVSEPDIPYAAEGMTETYAAGQGKDHR